jgi:hypothetical protein
VRGLLQYLDPGGWFRQWYWPPGVHGRAWFEVRKLGEQLLTMLVLAVIFSALFIILDWAVYGRVNW